MRQNGDPTRMYDASSVRVSLFLRVRYSSSLFAVFLAAVTSHQRGEPMPSRDEKGVGDQVACVVHQNGLKTSGFSWDSRVIDSDECFAIFDDRLADTARRQEFDHMPSFLETF